MLLVLHETTEPLSIADIASRLSWLTSSGRPNRSRATHTLERLRGANLVRRERGRLVLTEAGQKIAQRLERLAEN
jgi:Mn-dependent DtxR family transcriptional regulator